MATQNEIDSWYQQFAKNGISQMGINLYNPKDVERLRVPSSDGKSTTSLFENGFQNTPENRKKLYESAQMGSLFAFSKTDNKPYQIRDKEIKSCAKEDQIEPKRANIAQKIGLRVANFAMIGPTFAVGLAGRLLNLFTLGIFENQINSLGRGLASIGRGLAEQIFSVSAQEKEAENKVGLFERIGNIITFGDYNKDRIKRIDRQNAYEKNMKKMSNALETEKTSWEKQRNEEIQKKEEQKNITKTQKELTSTNEKLKTINQPRQEMQIGGNDQAPEDKGKEMKTKLQHQYEEMRMAFGPGGGGFVEAVQIAQDMNRMIERLEKDENALKASGMKKEDLKKFSNMCTNMESIMKDGLEAKKDLMSVEKSETLSKEQREQKICQIRLMDMVERAMVNSAYMDYMDKGKQPGMEATKMRSSRIFNAMEKNPDALKEKLYNDIKQLDSTNQLMGMSGKELSEFISEPTNVRNAQNEDMRKAVETRQAEREQAQQLTQQQQQPQMQQQQPQMQQQTAM